MNELIELLSSFGTMVWIALFVISVFWFLLPFAIFGIKPLLRVMVANDAEIIKGLEHLSRQLTTCNKSTTKEPK